MSEEGPKLFKSHKTSFYTKSVLSPCGTYWIAGSEQENGLWIWNTTVANKEKESEIEYLDKSSQFIYDWNQYRNGHTNNINGVDWWKTYAHPFIASSSDDGTICLWQ